MPRGAKPKQYPPGLVERVRYLYHARGKTQGEVAAVLQTTQKVIYNVMRRHGIPTRIAAKRDQRGPRNHMWKGKEAGYQAFHLRVQSLRGIPQHCEDCGTSEPSRWYDWANLTGQYDDPSDYKRLCRSCHWKMDGTVENLKGVPA